MKSIFVNQSMQSTSKLTQVSLAVVVCLGLGACSTLEEDKIDYKSATKGNALEVPPDLVQLSRDNRYGIPGATTASGFLATPNAQPATATAAITMGDVQIERSGNQRWLVVNRAPEKIFPLLRDFWTTNGFLLTTDEQSTGILETDWAENRAKLPQDFIRATLGKLIDSVYSTGERDKFRTRVEANGKGGTDIFISHRGMIEKYQSGNSGSTVWTVRPADSELEAEFLRRMMVKLGVTQEQSKQQVAAAIPVKLTSKVATVDGQPVVQIDEGFDRAWRRVGLALDRTGFTVEDRDRAQGIYFVRYVAPNPDKKEQGFFAKIFNSETANAPLKYRITVKSTGNQTMVSVQNAAGAAAVLADAQNIVKVLADDLK